jgi:ABC-type amino acid transport substrate-binding protein
MEVTQLMPRWTIKTLQCINRGLLLVAALLAWAAPVNADDWGMGASNSRLSRPDVFAPIATPAYAIDTLAWFAIAVCADIALVLGGLLAYSIVCFRTPGRRRPRAAAGLREQSDRGWFECRACRDIAMSV